MRTLAVAAVLLGTVVALQAREMDSPRGMRSPTGTVKQLVNNPVAQLRGKPSRTRLDHRNDRDFSAEVVVPDICRGC